MRNDEIISRLNILIKFDACEAWFIYSTFIYDHWSATAMKGKSLS